MFKKILLITNVFILSFLLFSCKKELKISEKIIINNLPKVEQVIINDKQVKINNLGDLDVISDQELRYGILVVKDSSYKKGFWSLKEDRLIIPLQEISGWQVMSDSVFGAYIKVSYNTNEISIFDLNGTEVVQRGRYYSVNVNGSKKMINDQEGNFQNYEYFETVTSLSYEDWENGMTTSLVETYKVNIETKQRELSQSGQQYGDYYENVNNQIDLDDYGVKGHYAKILGNILYVYKDDNNKLITKINMPQIMNSVIFDGHLLYQVSYQLDFFSEEYTYIDNGYRYQLKTKSIDLLSGKEKEIDVDYRILGIKAFKDEKNVYNYAHITMQKIASKVINKEMTYEMIINSAGSVVADVTGVNFNQLRKLDEKHVFNNSNGMMYDEALNPLFEVPHSRQLVDYAKVIIINENGVFGAIDYDGKIVIPFEYKSLSTNFNDGKTYGVTLNNIAQFVSTDNVTKQIEDSYSFLDKGFLFVYDNVRNPSTNSYQGHILNYNGEIVTSFDLRYNNFSKETVSNAFGTYTIVSFEGTDGTIYLSIV